MGRNDLVIGVVAVGVGLLAYQAFVKKDGIFAKPQITPEEVSASPLNIPVSEAGVDPAVTIPSKEPSGLIPDKINLRVQNPDGSITTLQIDPNEFSLYQQWALNTNRYIIEDQTFIPTPFKKQTAPSAVSFSRTPSKSIRTTKTQIITPHITLPKTEPSQLSPDKTIRRVVDPSGAITTLKGTKTQIAVGTAISKVKGFFGRIF